jgi:glycosyltransferase involved in cell wall biosynthesis
LTQIQQGKRFILHILHAIGTLSPAAGGPPEVVRQLVEASAEVGDTIEVVCGDSPAETFLTSIACPVHALGPSLLGTFAFSPRLWRWVNENAHRFDGIVMNGIWTFPDLAVRAAARRAQVPYGIFPHGALDPWFNRTYPLKHLKKILYWPLQYAVLRDARAVFFTSETERDLAKTSFRPNTWNSVVVPFGINDPEKSRKEHQAGRGNGAEAIKLRRATPAEQIEAFYEMLPVLRGRSFLLFLGRLHEKKGCDLLIRAFAGTAASVPKTDLVIAGPDHEGLKLKLQRLAEKLGIAGRVHWPGMIAGDIKWGALRASDAFALPSHQENFGVAVIESLAAGRPVLISDQVNIWPEIKADGVGLVEEDTLEGTERLLHGWFNLPAKERDAMAIRARASFVGRYTMNRTAVAINRLFSPSELGTQTEMVSR